MNIEKKLAVLSILTAVASPSVFAMSGKSPVSGDQTTITKTATKTATASKGLFGQVTSVKKVTANQTTEPAASEEKKVSSSQANLLSPMDKLLEDEKNKKAGKAKQEAPKTESKLAPSEQQEKIELFNFLKRIETQNSEILKKLQEFEKDYAKGVKLLSDKISDLSVKEEEEEETKDVLNEGSDEEEENQEQTNNTMLGQDSSVVQLQKK